MKGNYNSSQINWIYIVDDTGSPIFIYESYIQGAQQNNFALLSHLLTGIMTVAAQVKDNEVKDLIMGANRYFITKIATLNYSFIIKSVKEVDSQEVSQFLNKIKKRFVENYADKMNLTILEKRKVFDKFMHEIKNMLDLGIDYEKLFK